MQLIYTRDYEIGYAHTDPKGDVRPSFLLACMQDIAGRHSIILGNARDILMEKYRCFWMLVRVQFHLLRPISGDETLTVTTWARSIKGAMTYRDFEFHVNGELVGDAQSAWVVANFDTRKLVRLSAAGITPDFLNSERSEGKDIGHIRFPQEPSFSYARTVRVSDLDVNYHLNNTKYADIVLDTLHTDVFEKSFVSDFQINYLQECLPGETLSVLSFADETAHYICGEKDEKRCFEAKMEFAVRQQETEA